MTDMLRKLVSSIVLVCSFNSILLFSPLQAADFDLVIQGGRVIDPLSGLDAIRNVGLRAGKISAISKNLLSGKEILDATGLIVAPGFIDLHAHGQNNLANEYQARDGVTTALEMEMGVYPLKAWYASREDNALLNYGATVSHSIVRAKALGAEPENKQLMSYKQALAPGYSTQELSPETLQDVIQLIDEGLAEGGLGVGIGLAYLPGARRSEIYSVYQLAALHYIPVFVHARVTSVKEPDSISALQELIANSVTTGAATHICHIGSLGGVQVPTMLEMIMGARSRGIDISTEVYPYTAAHTFIGAAIFSGKWRENIGMDYSDLQWTLSGERLSKQTFEKYRKENPQGSVIAYFMPDSVVDLAVSGRNVMIASDGGDWENNAGHPRGAGTFSRVLGRYVRERGLLSLKEALAKMTILPAQRLEKFVPAMKRKGRIAVGADADITVFDAAEIVDKASYTKPMQYSIGVKHVLVNGVFVVRNAESRKEVFPGKPVMSQIN
ncbi:MAG: amidohydrolase family protein [Gammaproteobacteria bacterium]|nr:amidohydrolase family protein [Gammaproteobacteria bacterium]